MCHCRIIIGGDAKAKKNKKNKPKKAHQTPTTKRQYNMD